MCGFIRLATLQFELKLQKCIRIGITIFKIFIWGGISSHIRSEIMFYGSARAEMYNAISDPYIRPYTCPNENFEYGYPHSNAFLQFRLKLERCKPQNATCHPMICDIISDVKLFPTVYRRTYCHKFLTLSNQTSHTFCQNKFEKECKFQEWTKFF